MTFHETIKSSSTSEFESFLSDIHTLKANEIKEGIAHLETMSVDELTFDDMDIYDKLKNHILSIGEFEVYRQSAQNSGNKSRIDFAGYIGNMLTASHLKEQFAKKDINL